MSMIDNAIILALIALAFFAGKRMSDNYHADVIEELRYQLRLNSARDGVGYVAPPTRRRANIGQDFMDKLHSNGRAVQKV